MHSLILMICMQPQQVTQERNALPSVLMLDPVPQPSPGLHSALPSLHPPLPPDGAPRLLYSQLWAAHVWVVHRQLAQQAQCPDRLNPI